MAPRLTLPTEPLGRPLRVCIVTQEDPFYIPLFFREFLRSNTERDSPPAARTVDLRGIMIQPPLGTRGARDLAARIWSLYGAIGFLRIGFRYLGAKMRRRLYRGVAGVHLWPRDLSVEFFAQQAGIPLLEFPPEPSLGSRTGREIPNNANGPTFIAWLREEAIDLIVSVSASQIFRATVLSAPTLGAINLHNAPLPWYRGMLPNFRQMAAGERESVLTIHEMRVQLDRGGILLQRGTPITAGMSLDALIRATKTESARALRKLLGAISGGTARLKPLPDAEGSYFGWPSREEAREFRRRGGRLL